MHFRFPVATTSFHKEKFLETFFSLRSASWGCGESDLKLQVIVSVLFLAYRVVSLRSAILLSWTFPVFRRVLVVLPDLGAYMMWCPSLVPCVNTEDVCLDCVRYNPWVPSSSPLPPSSISLLLRPRSLLLLWQFYPSCHRILTHICLDIFFFDSRLTS